MKNYFKLSDFIIDPKLRQDHASVPLHVAEKLVRYHLPILNGIREALGFPVIISAHSGYRSYEWEIIHGRSGYSEHTFKGLGAVDLTCQPACLPELKKALLASEYSRIAWYEHKRFFHCDFKDGELGRRFFEVWENGIWREVKNLR